MQHSTNSAKCYQQSLLDAEVCQCCEMQANVWTEYISDEDTVEYMTFPRLAALAEAVWSSKANKDWPVFKSRLPAFMKHIEAMGNKSRALS